MSLINQMLKDLEKRSQKENLQGQLLTGLEAAAPKKKTSKKSLLVLALIALCAVWIWNIGYYYYKHRPLLTVQNTQPTAVVEAKVEGKPDTPVVPLHDSSGTTPAPNPALASLTSIHLQTQGTITHLRFVLTREVVYQLSSDLKQNRMTISLKGVRLMTNPPLLDYINSAVKVLTLMPDKQDDLMIVLQVNPGVSMANLEFNKQGPFPELRLDLEMKNANPANDDQAKVNLNSELYSGTLKKVAVELNVDQLYQQALNLAESGQVYNSIHQLAALVDKHPDYHAARESLVSLLLQQGSEEKAKEFLSVGLHLQPYYPPFVELKARMLVDKGQVMEALDLLRKAPPAFNANPEYYAFIAALYQRLGQLTAAEKLYAQLTSLHPEKGAWWLGLGITLEGQGKSAQAIEAYNRADSSADLSPELRGYVGTRLRA